MAEISVLLPVYNGARYICRSINSVLAQTFSDFEIIVIDDCSTDVTPDLLSKYNDERVRIFRNETNMGVALSLNRGLSESSSPIIARQDADDISHPDRFLLQSKYLKAHPECVALGSQLVDIDLDGKFIDWRLVPIFHVDIVRRMLMGRGGQVPHPAAMCRRDALISIGGYRQTYELAEDLDLFLRLSEMGKLANLPSALVCYRVHGGSVSEKNRPKQLEVAALAARDALMRRGKSAPYSAGVFFDLKYGIFKRIMRTYLNLIDKWDYGA